MQELKNYMEECVLDVVDSVIKSSDVCSCEKCKSDIMAIALNKLPPKYVVTRKGEIYTKIATLHNQFDVDVISALTMASGFVKDHPRHDNE